MQTFATSNTPPTGPKNYVFVDEHNRHKRLKVMRACEGCRRRKIKCDSATTNSWPCAACTRLKLHCVPPVGGIDGEIATTTSFNTSDALFDLQQYSQTDTEDSIQSLATQQRYPSSFDSDPGQPLATYHQYHPPFAKPSFSHVEDSYETLYSEYHSHPHQLTTATIDSLDAAQPMYRIHRSESDAQTQTSIDQHTAEDLSQHLGDLKIAENGVAPYLRQHKTDSKEPDAPIQEIEFKVAAFSTDAGSQIRIPPALMPEQEDALRYFQTFFRDVHPYAPVLCRNQFYHQWHTDKSSISPLVLEAVFACAGRMSDDPAQGAQWLGLANKHEACYLDTPRLSTLQALLLLLKARESAPKRGYYYRSWMTCKTIVSMAIDLELNDHHEIHTSGESCGSDPVECLTKTRIWQTILICEMMVGAPQGRRDFGVDPNTIDISPNPPCSDIDDFEKSISRQFAYFLRNARNIRLITDVTQKIKNKKDWGLDKGLVAYNVAFTKWPDDIPSDLQVVLPANGGVAKVPSHFIGNMHSHYHLGIVMLRRPQLSASQSFATDNAWKHHMTVCYNSAKALCRIQEAILTNFNLAGLLCMQRGINFTIYAILTCVMIHLIAITSPDPDFNSDAQDYFERHMRILEKCISAWPMPETEAQINGLRAAFSADVSKPFELKKSFPLGSPSEQHRSSPTQLQLSEKLHHNDQQPQQQQLLIPPSQTYIPHHVSQAQQSAYLATPPVSAVSNDSKPDSPQYSQSYSLEHVGYAGIHSDFYQPGAADTSQWNPTPIIDQFNTAFAIPPAALAPPPSVYGSSPTGQLSTVPSNFTTATNSPPYNTQSYSHHYQKHQLQQQQQQQQQTHQMNYYQPQQHPSHHQQTPFLDTAHPNSMPSIVAGASLSHPSQQQHHPNPQPHPLPQVQQQQQQQFTSNTYAAGGVFVTPKEWQRSVASVYDPGALKRRWDDYAQQQQQSSQPPQTHHLQGQDGGDSRNKRR